MPLTPEQRARYPKDWPEISGRIRFVRAQGMCECDGRCGLHDGQCDAVNGNRHPVTDSRVVLTVAHLNHTPEDCDDSNLMAMCQRCHLTYDANHRRRTNQCQPQLDLAASSTDDSQS